MSRLRRYRSFRSVASILLLVALWGSPHRSQDDSACLPIVSGEHDASKHALGPVGPIQDEHCAICHWLRGLKPSFRVTLADGIAILRRQPVSLRRTHSSALIRRQFRSRLALLP